MVFRHWGLTADPFRDGTPPFVPTPGHAEAVERLRHAITSGERTTIVRAPAGLGKTTVLREALRLVRRPNLRVACVSGPIDGPELLGGLAEGLGGRRHPGRAAAWRGLVDAARVCRWQGSAVVLAVDDSHLPADAQDRLDLARLAHIDTRPGANLTVILSGRESEEDEPSCPWGLTIRLPPLSRAEAAVYLEAKLTAAGREGATFTPRAVTRLHALCSGVPRGLDRLASLALMAGALRGLEVVGPELVEGVARECRGAA